MNLNKVFLIGNLTRDPELKNIPSGQAICQIGIATNRNYTDKAGQKQQQVEFHNVVFWGKLAELVAKYMKKGQMLYVEGRLQTRSWDDKASGQKRYKTEIVGENMQFGPRLGGAGGGSPTGVGVPRKEVEMPAEELATVEYPEDEIKPEDIPF
ncbi:MAG: single-stranded DNA-binding protein [bacterium]|nr:single-stranded DNA-binding protein [bacterium]